MTYDFKPTGVCSRKITFDLENNVVSNVSFTGGCSGNTQGLSVLCEGRNADEIIQALKGIRCGYKSTSCPDQLAKAIAEAKSKQ